MPGILDECMPPSVTECTRQAARLMAAIQRQHWAASDCRTCSLQAACCCHGEPFLHKLLIHLALPEV